MDASEVTRRLRERLLYASFLSQKNRMDGGCGSSIRMTNNGSGSFESSLIPMIKEGDLFMSSEQRSAVTTASSCQTFTVNDDIYMIGSFLEDPLQIYDKNGNLINNSMNRVSSTNASCFLARFNSSNELQWITRIGSTGRHIIESNLIVDNNGSVYIAAKAERGVDDVFFYNASDINSAAMNIPCNDTMSVIIAKYSDSGIIQWATHIDVSGTPTIYPSLAIDSSYNLYVAACMIGNTTIYQASDNYNSINNTSSSGFSSYLCKYTPNGEFVWVTRTSGAYTDSTHVICDKDDNIYITSESESGIDIFNASDLSNSVINIPPINENYYNFIIKYNSNGEYIWINRFGGANDSFYSMTTIDSQNNVYFMGVYMNATVSIYNATDLNTVVATLPNSGNYDIAIIKYNSNGIYQWGTHLSGTGEDREVSIAVDKDDNIIVLGRTDGSSIDIYDTTSEYSIKTLNFPSSYSTLLVKYNSNGEHIWSTYSSQAYAYYFSDVQTNTDGNIIVSAGFDTPTVDLYDANGSVALTLTQQGSTYNTYTAIYNSAGTPFSANTFINTDYNNISVAFKP